MKKKFEVQNENQIPEKIEEAIGYFAEQKEAKFEKRGLTWTTEYRERMIEILRANASVKIVVVVSSKFPKKTKAKKV